MENVTLVEFNSNIAHSLGGWARQEFKKWAKVLVDKWEVLQLLRLWCTVVGKFNFDYEDNKKLIDSLIKKQEAEDKAIQAKLDVETEKYLAQIEKANKEAKKIEEKRLKKIEEDKKELEKKAEADRVERQKAIAEATKKADEALIEAKVQAKIEADKIDKEVEKRVKAK